MTVEQWAAIIAAGAAVVLVAIVLWVAVSVRQTLRDVRETVVEARHTLASVDPLVTDVRSAMTAVETVLKTPGVKAAALASGVGRGVQHLREKLH